MDEVDFEFVMGQKLTNVVEVAEVCNGNGKGSRKSNLTCDMNAN